jgi:hypothetical protein
MKRTLLSLCMLVTAAIVYGQAKEGTVEYEKTQQPAAVIELPYSPNVVEAAMNDYLIKKGRSRANDIKGFSTFRNTQLSPTDSMNADLYFKVERKSKKEKEITNVSLLLYPHNKDFAVTVKETHLNMEQAKDYLDQLVPAIEAYNLELQIKEQNDRVIKAESKYKNLVENGNDLNKDKINIEQKIVNNKDDQARQTVELAKQKQALALLVDQRKS